MSSNIEVKNGIYDASKRFAFTNIRDTDFTFKWDGKPITVKAGETIELPHHLAVLATLQLTDEIMIKGFKESNPDPLKPSPQGTSLGVPAARAYWEQKILRELEVDEESPQITIMRMKIKEELERDLNKEKSKPVESIAVGQSEFAELKADKKK